MPNRRPFLIALCTSAAIAALAAVTPALAFERPFPPFAKRGVMRPDMFPSITIDGKPRIMTPGARIWNPENMIETPASYPIKNYVVNYTEDETSYIDRVWILTDEEAAQSPKAQRINQPRY